MIHEVFFALLMLGSFFVFGVALWALGQCLRRKGYGPQLDVLDREYTALQLRVNRIMLPAASHFYSGMSAYNRLPVIGSKNQHLMADRVKLAIQIEEKAQSRSKT
jgi:hypothetical protein